MIDIQSIYENLKGCLSVPKSNQWKAAENMKCVYMYNVLKTWKTLCGGKMLNIIYNRNLIFFLNFVINFFK